MAVDDLWGKMILQDIINYRDSLARALHVGLYFATTLDLQSFCFAFRALSARFKWDLQVT